MNNNKDDAVNLMKDLFSQYKNTSGYKDSAMMEIWMRRKEFEENLDEMWAIYRKGSVIQIGNYQKGVDQIKHAGLKVLRNSAGKHKIVNK